jgi:hypothetical protein
VKRREKILLGVVLGIMLCTASGLLYLKAIQRLGAPGVKSSPIEGSLRRVVELPQAVPGYISTNVEMDSVTVNSLPPDTSFGRAFYQDLVGRVMQVSVVMMGTDRTSIHKPQFCLTGQGWAIDESKSSRELVSLDRPYAVELPVMKLVASRTFEENGQEIKRSGVYVYWFVAGGACTENHWERMWWMARHLAQTGELQRWAYISYFMPCQPGQEDAAFECLKRLVRASVPEFQLAWPASGPSEQPDGKAR